MNGSNPIDVLNAQAGPAPAAAGDRARTPDEVRLLAAQFESMLLSQMLTQMRSSMFDDEEGDSGFAKGPLGDAMYSELSLALGRAGGFGLADSMIGPLMKEAGEMLPGAAGTLSLPSASPLAMPDPGGLSMRPALFDGRLTSSFGWRQHPVSGGMKFHEGVDIAMPVGHDVPAARAGQVAFAGEQGGYGLTVVIDHGDGVSTRYAHLSELQVKAGDPVGDGQTIGLSGATGRVTGPHLHFEVLENGQAIDPAAGVGRLYAAR